MYTSALGVEFLNTALIARFMGPTWGTSGADRDQVGPCWPHELCYLGVLYHDHSNNDDDDASTKSRPFFFFTVATHTLYCPILMCLSNYDTMMTTSNGNISALLALCKGIHQWPVDSPCKGQWRGALMFSLMCARTNGWAKHWRCRRFETPWRSWWRHCNIPCFILQAFVMNGIKLCEIHQELNQESKQAISH